MNNVIQFPSRKLSDSLNLQKTTPAQVVGSRGLNLATILMCMGFGSSHAEGMATTHRLQSMQRAEKSESPNDPI